MGTKPLSRFDNIYNPPTRCIVVNSSLGPNCTLAPLILACTPPQHDSNPQCKAYKQQNYDKTKGNYVMYSSATSGNLDNNYKFSTCSIQLITNTIHSVVNQLVFAILNNIVYYNIIL